MPIRRLWDTTRNAAGFSTFSSDQLTVQDNAASGDNTCAFDVVGHGSGKYIASFQLVSSTTPANDGVGLGTGSASSGAVNLGVPVDGGQSFGMYGDGISFWCGGTTFPNPGIHYSVGDTIDLAADLNGSQFWIRSTTTPLWNNSSTANPSTGVGGITFASIGLAAGPYFPAVNLNAPQGSTFTIVPSPAVSGYQPWASIPGSSLITSPGTVTRTALAGGVGGTFRQNTLAPRIAAPIAGISMLERAGAITPSLGGPAVLLNVPGAGVAAAARGFNTGSFSSDLGSDFQPPGVTVVSPNVPGIPTSVSAGLMGQGILLAAPGQSPKITLGLFFTNPNVVIPSVRTSPSAGVPRRSVTFGVPGLLARGNVGQVAAPLFPQFLGISIAAFSGLPLPSVALVVPGIAASVSIGTVAVEVNGALVVVPGVAQLASLGAVLPSISVGVPTAAGMAVAAGSTTPILVTIVLPSLAEAMSAGLPASTIVLAPPIGTSAQESAGGIAVAVLPPMPGIAIAASLNVPSIGITGANAIIGLTGIPELATANVPSPPVITSFLALSGMAETVGTVAAPVLPTFSGNGVSVGLGAVTESLSYALITPALSAALSSPATFVTVPFPALPMSEVLGVLASPLSPSATLGAMTVTALASPVLVTISTLLGSVGATAAASFALPITVPLFGIAASEQASAANIPTVAPLFSGLPMSLAIGQLAGTPVTAVGIAMLAGLSPFGVGISVIPLIFPFASSMAKAGIIDVVIKKHATIAVIIRDRIR